VEGVAVRDDAMKDAAIAQIAASGVSPGQRYRHYKTGNVYLVIAVGLSESDLEPLVHYRVADDEYAIIWTRHLHIFHGRALQGDVLVSRFTLVS
jgi:hypothetical protein